MERIMNVNHCQLKQERSRGRSRRRSKGRGRSRKGSRGREEDQWEE